MEQIETMKTLLPLIGELTVLSCAVLFIGYLLREKKTLRASYKEEVTLLRAELVKKDTQLTESIDAHLLDMKSNNRDYKEQVENFTKFATIMKDIIMNRKS